MIVKYNISLKTLLRQGILESVFYGNLVYKFKRIAGKPDFSDRFIKITKRYKFKKIIKRYKIVGYSMDIMASRNEVIIEGVIKRSLEGFRYFPITY